MFCLGLCVCCLVMVGVLFSCFFESFGGCVAVVW